MKCGWTVLTLMLLFITAAPQQKNSFSDIDRKAEALAAPTPDSLAALINANFFTPPEKLRAIYAWITANISYNTIAFKKTKYVYSPDPLDTAATWPSGDEMMARKVMRTRTAFCDGYARLFKVLCEYAGLQAAVILGYGRTNRGDGKFRTNHTWNAVRLDSTWRLLDLTWASGYVTFADDFVALRNDYYYLTPPAEFITDHYPEDLYWSLLPSPPMPPEFRRGPFRSKHFYRYDIGAFSPSNGVIEASVGDTLRFSFILKDAERIRKTSSDALTDTTDYARWPKSGFAKPSGENGATVFYQYIVEQEVEWIHLLYKNDAVLHYCVMPAQTTANRK